MYSRLYISTAAPKQQLNLLYLIGHNMHMWFQLRSCSSCTDGAPNLLQSVQLLLADSSTTAAAQCSSQSSEECPLGLSGGTAAFHGSDWHRQLRTRAVQTTQYCRQQLPTGQVRPYILPRVRFSATSLPELEWEKVVITDQR